MLKKILYVDMDNVLVDFPSGIAQLDTSVTQEYAGRLDEVPGIFSLMSPMAGAIEAFHELADLQSNVPESNCFRPRVHLHHPAPPC